MICVVRCHQDKDIQLPAGQQKQVGDLVPCPENCGKRGSVCWKNEEFNVQLVRMCETSTAQAYTPEEIASKWNTGVPSSEPEVSAPMSESSAPTPNAADRTAPATESSSRPATILETARKYNLGLRRGEHLQPNAKEERPSDELVARKKYNKFLVRGIIYSDDPAERNRGGVQPLEKALWAVFSFWETKIVFKDANTLQDDFIWLLTSIFEKRATKIKKSDVDPILQNAEYTIQQKFFYLFYDVIYKYDPPKKFYWCDRSMSYEEMVPYFTDRADFVAQYSDCGPRGAAFRALYQRRKQEMLHFLMVENEEIFFENLVLEIARQTRNLVLINKNNDYSIIPLGSMETFIHHMQVPSDLSLMRDMITFLRKYRICNNEVVVRTEDHPFEISRRGDLDEDESMYSALALSASSSHASEYDCYVTLLREYMGTFRPDKITVGELTFTKDNYSNEIKRVVGELGQVILGEVRDEASEKKYKGRAWLTKSLYEREILASFHCENDQYIQKLMDLIKSGDPKKYFELYGKEALGIREYIERYMDEDLYTICGRFQENNTIRECFQAMLQDKQTDELHTLLQHYQEQYEAFING